MQQVIEQLKQIVTSEQILVDPEDLYVYSFERIFEKSLQTPDIVVRTLSSQKAERISELAEAKGFTVTKRERRTNCQELKRPLVLIDDVPAPELKKASSRKGEIREILREIRDRGHGTPRNIAFAVKSLLVESGLGRCEECETCSGYCTVTPSFEGVETWSSKGRILLIRGLQDKKITPSRKIVDVLYTCTECGLCFAECFEALEVNKAILATRHQTVKEGLAPAVFYEAAKNIMEIGDPGAFPVERRLSWMKEFHSQVLPKKAEVLYWVGCMVADRTPKTAEAFFKILSRTDVDFTMLKEREGCCGYVLLSTGFWSEAKKVAEEVSAKIEETGIGTLVTSCAGCYYTFTKLYPEILDVSLPCEVLHSSQFVEKLIKEGRIDLKGLDFRVSYHDPCSLGRHSGVFDAPRNVLKAIPDLTLAEMSFNREMARCCGGGGGLWSFNHQVSMDSAHLRLKDWQRLNVDVLATSCPLCQINFRYTSARKSIPTKVCDITEIVESSLH